MKIVLCGLTGLGNVTLEELIKLKINVTKFILDLKRQISIF